MGILAPGQGLPLGIGDDQGRIQRGTKPVGLDVEDQSLARLGGEGEAVGLGIGADDARDGHREGERRGNGRFQEFRDVAELEREGV